jgi:DNA-binding MarR family transcriptional regulator
MASGSAGVKVQNTQVIDPLVAALVDLTGFLASPQRDEALLREAGVSLDRALFPLLVRLGAAGSLGVAALADAAGRDHTTVSRQLAKLGELGLVERLGAKDRRLRAARLSATGEAMVAAITAARRRVLARALADWSDADARSLAALNRRFADALVGVAHGREPPD